MLEVKVGRASTTAAYIRAHSVRNAQGRLAGVYSHSELAKFLDEHIRLTDIVTQSGNQPRRIKTKLDACGIDPIAPRSQVDRYFYRRSDIAGITLI